MDRSDAANLLIDATLAMAREGVPLMRRLLPSGVPQHLWDHYPEGDAVAPSGSRYFYHSHPPEERGTDEHGHFHLFLPRRAMPDPDTPRLAAVEPAHDGVHLVALSVAPSGLPVRAFTTNRWVTDEWLFDAAAIIAALDRFDLRGAPGDPLVNDWLTAAVALARPVIDALLTSRDATLAALDPRGEDRAVEVLSSAPLDLQALLDA
ncbi:MULTISPECIES: DUF6969 family protein [Sphingomonas]|uniref:DUF6969 family protein n=1 Tax=Sphingomonas TaxID=13687 RepID=UPI0008332B92|nr:hypothetical protein [Sphingomonas sp. CCH10-B3]